MQKSTSPEELAPDTVRAGAVPAYKSTAFVRFNIQTYPSGFCKSDDRLHQFTVRSLQCFIYYPDRFPHVLYLLHKQFCHAEEVFPSELFPVQKIGKNSLFRDAAYNDTADGHLEFSYQLGFFDHCH